MPCPVLVEKGPLHDFRKSYSCDILLSKEGCLYGSKHRETAKKYIDNPPEGMTSEDIRHMNEDDLLDMDYFLNEDDPFDDGFGEEGLSKHRLIVMSRHTFFRIYVR